MIWQRNPRDLYRDLRQRILAETEQYLNLAIRNPRIGVRIPRIRVGRGSFTREFADAFWAQVLSDEGSV